MPTNVCTISDLISGGSILPHVYCKNISLENGFEEGSTNVVLNLEILQSKKELNKKNYLSELTPLGSAYSFSDYLFRSGCCRTTIPGRSSTRRAKALKLAASTTPSTRSGRRKQV